MSMDVFTVVPPHTGLFGTGGATDAGEYSRVLDEHCAWADKLGASAMLIYDFWQSLDPWVVAHQVLARTATVEPIVAVAPALSHPTMVARRIASLCYLYGRRINLNVVNGAKAAETAALSGPDARVDKYARMVEFLDCLRAVLRGEPYRGAVYQVETDPPEPAPGPADQPRILVPGSTSPGFTDVLPRIDRALAMAKPLQQTGEELDRWRGAGLPGGTAMIVGIVARDTDAAARETATRRFAGGRRDALVRAAFRREVTSSQHLANFEIADAGDDYDECLWYGAGRVGIDCPKLVGSYATVARALEAYQRLGVRTLVIDLPDRPAEYHHIDRVLDQYARSGPPA